jgi:phosphoribosylamine---glycine ligase
MNVLILGSGGREHAMAWKIAQSPMLDELFIAPGNAGTTEFGTNLNIDVLDFPAVREAVITKNISLVVVGPEVPLVEGIVDYFRNEESLTAVGIVGPDRFSAQLEGSKDFAKQFMQRHQIPTARYRTFTNSQIDEGLAFLRTMQPPYVLKADGLAAGKGVIIPETLELAESALRELLSGQFGLASSKVVIEEFLQGIEMSAFVLTDGSSYVLLPEAKDYKRIGEGDTGPNTGGMGAVSPVPFVGEELMQKIISRVIEPTIDGLKKDGVPYCGFIFFGLINVQEEPYVIEYNCRMGDPETEVVLPRIQNDLLELLQHAVHGTLSGKTIDIDPRTAATVMLVSRGYPESAEKGVVMSGLEDVGDSILFHAGTTMHNGKIVTNGGRVLSITSYGSDLEEALERSMRNAEIIEYDGKYYRKDIGQDLMKYLTD